MKEQVLQQTKNSLKDSDQTNNNLRAFVTLIEKLDSFKEDLKDFNLMNFFSYMQEKIMEIK